MSIIIGALLGCLVFVLASFLFKLSPHWCELPDGAKLERGAIGCAVWTVIGATLGLFHSFTLGA